MKKLFVTLLLAFCASFAQAQFVTGDPCLAPSIAKASAIINVSTATTTSLVAPVTGSQIYVCGYTLTISQVITTANTMKFVYGTGATCGTGTTDLSAGFGTGGITAAAPLVVASGLAGTQFVVPASNRLCVTTTVGATAAFTGVMTYIQQP